MRRGVSVWNKKTKRYKLRKHKRGPRRGRKNPAYDDKAMQKLMAPQLLDALCATELSTALLNLPREQRVAAATLFRMFTEFVATANKRRKKQQKEKKP